MMNQEKLCRQGNRQEATAWATTTNMSSGRAVDVDAPECLTHKMYIASRCTSLNLWPFVEIIQLATLVCAGRRTVYSDVCPNCPHMDWPHKVTVRWIVHWQCPGARNPAGLTQILSGNPLIRPSETALWCNLRVVPRKHWLLRMSCPWHCATHAIRWSDCATWVYSRLTARNVAAYRGNHRLWQQHCHW